MNELNKIKLPEVIALVLLNISLIISWVAYNEYQPVLVQKFGLEHLSDVLLFGKAIILIIIPVLAGFMTDYLMKRNKKFFTVYSIGIAATGMTFMVVASMIPLDPSTFTFFVLPVMVVIWLVAMNLFVSPANSLIDLFAPKNKLPKLMAILFITSELTYSIEPIILDLIHFLGPALTFAAGGVLVVSSGIFFIKQVSDEITQRTNPEIVRVQNISLFTVISMGTILGLAHSFIFFILPSKFINLSSFNDFTEQGIATSLLILAAILSYPISIYWSKKEINLKQINSTMGLVIVSSMTIFMLNSQLITYFNTVLIIYSYVTLSIVSLPYIILRLDGRKITLGIGIFIGSTEIFDSIFEVFG